MIAENIKAELSEAAQDKLETIVATTVEHKIKMELKKAVRKITVKIIIVGVVVTGICLAINNIEKIIVLLKKLKKR